LYSPSGCARNPIYAAPSTPVRQLGHVATSLPEVHAHLDASRIEELALIAFPRAVWRQIWRTTEGRLSRGIHRRNDIVTTFPDRRSIIRRTTRGAQQWLISGHADPYKFTSTLI
jgi:hypothetical protein